MWIQVFTDPPRTPALAAALAALATALAALVAALATCCFASTQVII